MARYGFIHDKLDIKFLVLYIMARVAAPINFSTLTDLTLCDSGVDYFEFAEALAEMVESSHLTLIDERYAITDKGRRAGTACESGLPFSVKAKCNKNLAPLNGALRREAQVRATATPREDSGLNVCLSLDDETGNLLSIHLFSPNQEQADLLCQNFKARPERIFNQVLETLLAPEEETPPPQEPEAPDAKEPEAPDAAHEV